MWDYSFQSGCIPSSYKKALISPIFKKKSRSIAINYRPISITPHEIKIFERIIRDRLTFYLESNDLLSKFQHEFRKGKSCLTQLLKHLENIIVNLMSNAETDSIFLDFAKAFDKVDHQILLQKIRNLGITGKLYDWLAEFLSNRQQVDVLDGVMSYIALSSVECRRVQCLALYSSSSLLMTVVMLSNTVISANLPMIQARHKNIMRGGL